MAKAVDKAYQTVRERIVRGIYPAATRITEQEVAAAAGVSRTPVREALRKLHAEGLLEFIPHQGAIVTEWTSEDREDVFEMRALLESYGAARAARRITDAGIVELRSLAEDQYHETLSRTEGYLERIGHLNSQFHRRIHEFAGSPRLVSALASLIEAPLIMKTFEAYQDEDLIRSASHHLEIVRALEARDGDWCAALMRSHILGARGALRLL
jgi:DNA-binding GntR family transcriptional regulator